jgi:hypothetical protein
MNQRMFGVSYDSILGWGNRADEIPFGPWSNPDCNRRTEHAVEVAR